MISMKGIAQIYLILGILLILGIAAYQGWLPLGAVGVCNPNTATYILNPEWGRYECLPAASTKDSYSNLDRMDYWEGIDHIVAEGWIKCGDDEYTSECEVWVRPRPGHLNANPDLRYRICSSRFPESCNAWTGKTPFRTDPQKIDDLSEGQYMHIKIYSLTGNLYSGNDRTIERFYPFVLWQIYRGYKEQKREDCRISPAEIQASGLCYEGCDNPIDRWKTELGPREVVNYLPSGSYDLGLKELLKTDIDGQKVICEPAGTLTPMRNVYNLKGISLSSGCYAVKGTLKKQVACCPGEQMSGMKCENWKWVPIEKAVGECTISIDECDGGGKWVKDWTDPAGKTAKRATECKDTQCIYETKLVQCTNDEQCEDPMVCGEGFICVQPEGREVRCGDGICSRTETTLNCPDDCKPTINLINMAFLGLVVALVLTATLAGLGFFIPQLKILWNIRNFLIAMIILTILLITVFTVPTLTMGQMIIGAIS